METDAVPVDLTQTWDAGHEVNGEESSLVYAPPEPDGHGGWVDADGNATDANGMPINVPDEGDLPVPDKYGNYADPPAPTLGSWRVSTGDLRDAESVLLATTKVEIDEFETFRDSVMQRASWIFFAESHEDTVVTQRPGDQLQGNGYATWSEGPAQSYAAVKDPNPEQTEALQYNQYQLLQGVGGVLELVGQYISRLNNTAQLYASSDISSAPPKIQPRIS